MHSPIPTTLKELHTIFNELMSIELKKFVQPELKPENKEAMKKGLLLQLQELRTKFENLLSRQQLNNRDTHTAKVRILDINIHLIHCHLEFADDLIKETANQPDEEKQIMAIQYIMKGREFLRIAEEQKETIKTPRQVGPKNPQLHITYQQLDTARIQCLKVPMDLMYNRIVNALNTFDTREESIDLVQLQKMFEDVAQWLSNSAHMLRHLDTYSKSKKPYHYTPASQEYFGSCKDEADKNVPQILKALEDLIDSYADSVKDKSSVQDHEAVAQAYKMLLEQIVAEAKLKEKTNKQANLILLSALREFVLALKNATTTMARKNIRKEMHDLLDEYKDLVTVIKSGKDKLNTDDKITAAELQYAEWLAVQADLLDTNDGINSDATKQLMTHAQDFIKTATQLTDEKKADFREEINHVNSLLQVLPLTAINGAPKLVDSNVALRNHLHPQEDVVAMQEDEKESGRGDMDVEVSDVNALLSLKRDNTTLLGDSPFAFLRGTLTASGIKNAQPPDPKRRKTSEAVSSPRAK